MPAAFKFLILALLSKKPPLYGFLLLKPGSYDNLRGNFSRSGDRMLVSVPIYLPISYKSTLVKLINNINNIN